MPQRRQLALVGTRSGSSSSPSDHPAAPSHWPPAAGALYEEVTQQSAQTQSPPSVLSEPEATLTEVKQGQTGVQQPPPSSSGSAAAKYVIPLAVVVAAVAAVTAVGFWYVRRTNRHYGRFPEADTEMAMLR